MVTRTYQLIDHTADFGLRIYGESRAALYENAGSAMFELIADPSRVTGDHVESLVAAGSDPADLMINWLRELLYLWHGRAKLVDTITVADVSNTRIAADLRMIKFDPEYHLLRNEIKAVTYHQLAVENPRAAEWVATIIFDV